MELTSAQQFTVMVLYLSSLLPAVIITSLYLAGKFPRWLMATYIGTFIICALGWEMWISYGLVDGLDVSSRRPEVMNTVIPLHINWLLNSLGDSAAVGLSGVLLVWLTYGRTRLKPFPRRKKSPRRCKLAHRAATEPARRPRPHRAAA